MEENSAHPYQFRHPSLLLDCPTNEMEFCENVAISTKQLGIKKATKSVILGTISYTFKFATVWNLAPQEITYTVLQQSGYKYVFLATNFF